MRSEGRKERGEEGEREVAAEDGWLSVPGAAGPGGVGTAVWGSEKERWRGERKEREREKRGGAGGGCVDGGKKKGEGETEGGERRDRGIERKLREGERRERRGEKDRR